MPRGRQESSSPRGQIVVLRHVLLESSLSPVDQLISSVGSRRPTPYLGAGGPRAEIHALVDRLCRAGPNLVVRILEPAMGREQGLWSRVSGSHRLLALLANIGRFGRRALK